MKTGTFYEKHWKATKTSDSTQISHYDLVFHRVQRECQLCICYILVVFGGACMCKWCMYTHILTWFCLFSWKVALFMKSTWKPLKSTWKATKQLIQHTSLIMTWCWKAHCRVQREGQLDISYILVVFGGVCGACMFKWYMYTHILTWFCWFSWKVVAFYVKTGTFCEKHWKHEKHMILCEILLDLMKYIMKFIMKSGGFHWKVWEETWKVKSTWKAHENWKHMKSIPEKWKHLKSEKHMKS